MKMMKRGLALVLALLLALGAMGAFAAEANAVKTVKINKTSFPDAKFRAFVKKEFDTDKNNKLSAKEIKAVTTIDVQKKGIANLKGVEIFVNLKGLVCSKNKLTKLDVSKNTKLTGLVCVGNKIKTLNVSKNKKLEILTVDDNKMTKLVLGTPKNLAMFGCSGNKLKSVDINGCPKLKKLLKTSPIIGSSGAVIWMSDDISGFMYVDPTTKIMAGKKVLYKK